jgi:hypothetical protein
VSLAAETILSFDVVLIVLKGTVSRDFRPLFFSSNCTPGSPDSWAKMVLHIDSNSRSNSIIFDDKNRLRAMPHSAESQLGAMPRSAESQLGAMWHSAESGTNSLCLYRSR